MHLKGNIVFIHEYDCYLAESMWTESQTVSFQWHIVVYGKVVSVCHAMLIV